MAVRSGIPVTGITLFFLGGVSRITHEPEQPGTEVRMAIAGPVSSLLLAGLFAVVWSPTRNAVPEVADVALWLMGMNLLLAVFNLVPGFPMDGGRVLRAAMWSRMGDYMRATRIASIVGTAIGLVMVVGGLASIVVVEGWEWQRGIWLVFIGVFLAIAARNSYRQEVLRDSLRHLTASDVMVVNLRSIPASVPLGVVATGHFQSEEQECLLVESDGTPKGLISERDLRRIPKKQWQNTDAAEAMVPLHGAEAARPADDGLKLLERMEKADVDFLPVMQDGELLGVVGRDRLLDVGLESPKTKS
jgi:CBS domain-containing protein